MSPVKEDKGTPCESLLFVHKSHRYPRSHPWRLLWSESVDAPTFCYAGGSLAVGFKTMREAVAQGEACYDLTALRHPD